MKKCGKCHAIKDVDKFNWKVVGKRRQSYCKQCQATYRHEFYVANKAKYVKKARDRNDVARARNREAIRKLKSSTPCKDCGKFYHWVQMDFDHVRGDKRGNVARLVVGYWGKAIKDEMDKCEIVCANCHRLRTHIRLINNPQQ